MTKQISIMSLLVMALTLAACCIAGPEPATPATSGQMYIDRERSRVWRQPSGGRESEITGTVEGHKGDAVWARQSGRALLRWPDLYIRLRSDSRTESGLNLRDATPAWLHLGLVAGAAHISGQPASGQRVAIDTANGRVVLTGTSLMLSYEPGSRTTIVRVFQGQVEASNVANLDDVKIVRAGQGAITEQEKPPRIFNHLEDMRPLARELGLWDLFHLIELDEQAGFGPPGAASAAAPVQIVFVDQATATPTRRPAATPTTTPRPCRPGVLYCQDFETGRADGWRLDAGWKVVRDGSNWVLSGSRHDFAILQNAGWDNYRLRFRLKPMRGAIHLNYRLTEDPTRYFVGFSQEGLSLSRQRGDRFDQLAEAEGRYALNRWHDVEIAGYGGQIQVYVDGKLALDYTDPNPLRRGTIGFETLDNSAALVDDIEILPARPAPTSTPTRTPTRMPTPTVDIPDITMRYWADQDCLLDVACTTLRWQVDNAQAVTLNGESVGGYDNRVVCPAAPAGEYTLRSVRGREVVEETIVVRRVTADLRVDNEQIEQGACTAVRWDVDGASAVYFNGEGVAGHDSRRVCPSTTTRYDLQVQSVCGVINRAVTVQVTSAPPRDTTGPAIGDLNTQPAGDMLCERSRIDVSTRITDNPSGVRNAELWVLFIPFNGVGAWDSIPMERSGDSFTASITGLGLGEVTIYVRAWDNAGNVSETPKRRIRITLC